MSVYACLGSDAAAIRDAFLRHMQSKTVDLRVKVTILEFLTVAVETQPGLIELFLNLETKEGSEGTKVVTKNCGRYKLKISLLALRKHFTIQPHADSS